MLSVEQEALSTIFKVFGMTQPEIEPRSRGPSANTLPTKPMSRDKNYTYTKLNCLN